MQNVTGTTTWLHNGSFQNILDALQKIVHFSFNMQNLLQISVKTFWKTFFSKKNHLKIYFGIFYKIFYAAIIV